MKKPAIITFFILTAVLRLYSQDVLTIVKKHNSSIEAKINCDFKLLLISDSGCGHCLIALEKIKVFQGSMSIIIVDYGEIAELKKLQEKYSYTFLRGNQIEKLGSQDFYPKLFLYDINDNLIWKKEGWFDKNVKKIKSKMQQI